MRRRWIWLMLAGLAAVGALAWWLTANSRPKGTLARIEREGVIRIGYAVEAPYAFLNSEGKLTGVEVEVAREVVARLGIRRVEWVQTDFGSLLSELEAKRFDAVVAGMFITPERAKRVSFSEPTFRVRQALLVRTGNPLALHSYEDAVRQHGISIAALHGSIEETTLQTLGIPETRIVTVPDALTGRVAVETGLASALALSSPTIRFMAKRQLLGSTEVATLSSPPASDGRLEGFGAAVFRKGDRDLREAWNRQLQGFIGSAAHRRLLAAFGLSADELPANVTTARILASGAP